MRSAACSAPGEGRRLFAKGKEETKIQTVAEGYNLWRICEFQPQC